MKWIEAKVIFEADNNQLAEELISDIFYDFRLQGVVIEEPDLEPAEGWGEDALERPVHYSVAGYLPDNEFKAERLKRLEQELITLKEKMNLSSYQVSYCTIDEEDWAHSWKDYFWPEKISQRCVVKPTWRDYKQSPNEIVIEIDPGMAFGTGTHPTTSLCINMIETCLKPGDSFLDIGTGSGILMAAAIKLGANYALGIDNDEVAVEIAQKNMILNGIPPNQFRVIKGDLAGGVEKRFDLVVANILADIVISLLDQVAGVLSENGWLICSGIVDNQKDSVIEKMTKTGFNVIDVRSKDSWVSISAKINQQVA
ncbi:MAG: 50S ribosomal protein L11 methyltransferase [Proteobacteria bacterium]|nr:50S ribosomal protein L11 methyltransferase [Pseudomonadota bacterium]